MSALLEPADDRHPLLENEEDYKMTIKNAAAGFALAIAAAGMFAGVATQASAADAQVHCQGVNACKGMNDCKTADHACKGMGSCKGQGFKLMTQTECSKAGGTVTK